jgi:hypothetical protein
MYGMAGGSEGGGRLIKISPPHLDYGRDCAGQGVMYHDSREGSWKFDVAVRVGNYMGSGL